MISTCVPLLVVLLAAGANCSSYLITAPTHIQPGADYDLSVDILNTTDVTVEATLQNWVWNGTIRDYDVNVVESASGVFGRGASGQLTLPISSTLSCQSCRLKIRGTGGLQFEQTKYVTISGTVVVLLIQTDKAIYKPGQIVRFRVFAVYPDLRMYTGGLNIEIKDPNSNKIKILNFPNSGEFGMVESSLQLSEQPQFGDWSIYVSAEGTRDSATQSFTVADYDLPRFEINVELPPFGLTSAHSLAGKVTAKYTFGEDVKGRVELHVGRDELPDACGNGPVTTQITFDIDGSADFEIPRDDISRAVSLWNNQRVKVTAFVKEEATGVRLNGSTVIIYYDRDSKVQFLDNTPDVFKPGLPYTAYIQVTTPDGKSPPNNVRADVEKLAIYTSAKYEITVPDQSFYSEPVMFTGHFPLKGVNATLPANGIVPVDIDIPDNATSITVKATFRGVVATKSVTKTWSQSNNYLRLTLLDSNVKAASEVTVKVEGTEPLGNISYEVIARGSKVFADSVDGNGAKTLTFNLNVTSDMAPVAHLLAYYPRGDNEIVADSLGFDVEGLFENEVSVSLSRDESEPNEQVEVLLTADPNSQVNVLAVDQSVLLLKSGNDITPEKVGDSISVFDRNVEKPSSPEFALSYSSSDVKDVFEKTGLMVITDVQMQAPPEDIYAIRMRSRSGYGGPPAYAGPSGYAHDAYDEMSMSGMMFSPNVAPVSDVSRKGASQAEVKRVRKFFPEAWLWTNTSAGENGTASLMTTVPDTITSWIVSAVATNPATGLGVAPTTAKLKVFRPFFVSLTYPSSVSRGEHVVVQATVFNYLSTHLVTTVKLKGNRNFQNILINDSQTESFTSGDREQRVWVRAGEQTAVYFPIKPTNIGQVEIEITARATVAADGVRRFISVRPEGAHVSYIKPVFIDINNNDTFMDTLNFTLPPSTVAGSEKAKVKVTGDIIGSSLHGLDSLLELPTGCGEQAMVKFAPNLYIGQYLRASGQLSTAVENRIKQYLAAGYQRQLTYQRYDKSFSAFGNSDSSGSTWLTAMVAGTFSEARLFTYIDPSVVIRAVEWLVQRQSRDGSFQNFGTVLDPNTQTSRAGEGLTAYVLTNILKSLPLANHQSTRDRWVNVTRSAVQQLEGRIVAEAVTDPLSLAMVSYALTLANSSRAQLAMTQLRQRSTEEGGLQYWDSSVSTATTSRRPSYSQYLIWRPPVIQARPANILTTSYAVLAMTAAGQVTQALPAVQWLLMQRNPNGGFASSQDTTVGLQALASYATASTRVNTDLSLTVQGNGETKDFSVTSQNAWTLQIKVLDSLPTSASVQASGSGVALLEMVYTLHVTRELSTPSFDVSTVLLDDDLDSFNLMVCTKWLWDRDTGMVVQEISIPSGFEPDLSTLGNVAGLKRSERRGNTVAVYFDKISHSSLCYSLIMTRTAKVARSQTSFVRTFDYYKPSDQSTVFYQPRKLKESTVCDVCDRCCQ